VSGSPATPALDGEGVSPSVAVSAVDPDGRSDACSGLRSEPDSSDGWRSKVGMVSMGAAYRDAGPLLVDPWVDGLVCSDGGVASGNGPPSSRPTGSF
jgi:hypothetical protein